ncbi:MAG: hypothetical protein HUU50_05260 [Candidatus Brocadiae bacterium]|nr:hypothetical protein [Candidatus Brocadiia bacterium]
MPLFKYSPFSMDEFAFNVQQQFQILEQKILQIENFLSICNTDIKNNLEKAYTTILPNLMNLEKILEKYLHSSKEETQKFKIITKEQENELKNFHQTLNNIELQLTYILRAFEILTNTQIEVIKEQLSLVQKQNQQLEQKIDSLQYCTNNHFKEIMRRAEEIK